MGRKMLNACVAKEQAERELINAERRGDLQGVMAARLDLDRLSRRIHWLDMMSRLDQFDILDVPGSPA